MQWSLTVDPPLLFMVSQNFRAASEDLYYTVMAWKPAKEHQLWGRTWEAWLEKARAGKKEKPLLGVDV